MEGLFWLLLPVAAASGWWLAQRSATKKDQCNPAYFRGLNYLINEEPDKAIDTFIEWVEIDKETVEIHIALGILFRRRGEVERAIRIHQGLIDRSNLNWKQREHALFELGLDYMRAGLYDRAEDLFLELKKKGPYQQQALENLLILYQQEKDWSACLEISALLESLGQSDLSLARSHYHCELADQALAEHDRQKAVEQLKLARQANEGSIRPLHMSARIAIEEKRYSSAIRDLHAAIQIDADYLPELLNDLYRSYQALNQIDSLIDDLSQLPLEKMHISACLCLTDLIKNQQGEQAALQFLSQKMAKRPHIQGLLKLIEFSAHLPSEQMHILLNQIKQQVESLIARHSVYQCCQCGFTANQWHWQCPSCRSWSSIRRKKAD